MGNAPHYALGNWPRVSGDYFLTIDRSVEDYAATVAAEIDPDYRADFLTALTNNYRDAITAELPATVWLSGSTFYSTRDVVTDIGTIREAIAAVDLWQLTTDLYLTYPHVI